MVFNDIVFSVFPAVLSMILMVIIRYISRVLVWILTVLVILGSLGKRFPSSLFSWYLINFMVETEIKGRK